MGFIKDIVKGIGKAIKGIVNAIGDVFEAVGEAISGLMDNPLMLIAAAALGFAAAPAIGAMLGGTTAAGAAAAGATAAVETVAGGAALGSMQAAVLGTGAELVGGAAAFGGASSAAAAAAGGLLADAASGMLTNLPVSAGGSTLTGVGGDMAATLAGGGSDMLLAGGSDMLVSMPNANAIGTLADSGGFVTQLPTGVGSAAGEAAGGGFWNSVTSGVGDFLKSPIDWMKSNKELVKMIGDGIQGWQKEEMEREKLDWQKEVYAQQQENWEAIHQPYDFSLYDPGAALQSMNQNLSNNGYLSQASQLQQAGYQPQFAVNQPYPYAMPNYDRMVQATYNRAQEQKPA